MSTSSGHSPALRTEREAPLTCGPQRRRALATGPLLIQISCLIVASQLLVATGASSPSNQHAPQAPVLDHNQQQQQQEASFQKKNVTTGDQPLGIVTADQEQEKQQHHHHEQQQQQQQQQQQLSSGLTGGSKAATERRLQPASLSSTMLRAFIRTNNMRAYHLDLHIYRPEVKFSGDPAFVNSSALVHQQRCRRQLAHYNDLLASYAQTDPMEMSGSLEALRLADTFGRPDAGLLDGHQFWLGSYEACREFSATLATEGAGEEQAPAHYCLGLAQFPSWKPDDTKTSIKIGLCLPESCTSSMLNEQPDLFELTERMMSYQLAGQPMSRLRLRSVYCLPHDSSQVRQLSLSAKLFISLVLLLLVVCLYATLHDYLNGKTATVVASSQSQQLADSNREEPHRDTGDKFEARTWRNILVESFSILRNYEKIVDTKERIEESDTSQSVRSLAGVGAENECRFNKDIFFNSITGIKCVGLIWIIAAHCFLVGSITHKNMIYLDKLTQTYLANVYLAAHLMVDSFFALSGLLAAYLLFKGKSLGRMRATNWLTLTVHRYWRLTPVYLLCYWFAKSLGHLVNSGPLWDYSTAPDSPRYNCAKESWLEAILYLSDFKSPKAHCVPFAWFIANGIKFWVVTPIFLTAIYKSQRAGYSLLVASILANIGIVISLAINSNVDMKSVIEFKPESADNMLNNMEDVYTRPWSRIGAYLVGLMGGHLIYLAETQRQPIVMSEKMKILIWSLVSATAIVLTFVVKIANGVQLEDSAIPWVFSFCSALIRPLWALCTCWLVFALAHGQARWLNAILSARMWRIVARLSFSAYLVQGEVIANLNLAYTHSGLYTYTDMITRPIVATVVTLIVSLIVALIVEYPLIGIEELILPRRIDKNLEASKQRVDKIASAGTTTTTIVGANCIRVKTNQGLPLKDEKLKEL